MTKMTYVAALSTAISALSENEQYAEVTARLSDLLARESKPKAKSAKQIAKEGTDAALTVTIVDFLKTCDEPKTAKQVLTECPDAEIAVLSVSKVATLLSKAVGESVQFTLGKRGVHLYSAM